MEKMASAKWRLRLSYIIIYYDILYVITDLTDITDMTAGRCIMNHFVGENFNVSGNNIIVSQF